MKSKSNPFLRSATLAASIFVGLAASAHAQTEYFWDANGAAANVGGAGNWSTANLWRSVSVTGTIGNWVDGSIANFGGTAGSVTITSGVTITTPRINVTTGSYAFSGGTVAFGGSAATPGILDVTNTTGVTFASNATGNLKVMATGNTIGLASAAPMIISGSTTLTSFELAMNQDQNHLILGNAAALGSSSATVKLTKGTLNLGNTSATNLSYNAWATDLAGGTIRARFAVQTWNGATSLSANSQLMTRNASDAKLVFSSTGTINLGSSSLTLMASSTSQGIELNGVISGTGNLATGSNPLGGTDNGSGTTTLNAANTFSGTATTTQNIGTLALGNVDALQNATLNTGAAAGSQAVTFTVSGANTYRIGALTGSDALALGANSISLGNKAGTNTFSADIGGTGGLSKTGSASTQTLAAATSYTGATNITGGTLSIAGSGAVNSSSGITINGNSAKLLHTGTTAITTAVTLTEGTLTGSGTVNTVNVGAGTGGVISNNNGVAGATLNIGSLTFAGGAAINLFSNSTAAPLNVTTLTNNSTAGQVAITASNPGGWLNGTTYNLISYTTLGGSGGNNFGQTVNNLSARQTPTWSDTGSIIQVTINGDTPRWNGSGDGNWNTTSTGNWNLITAGTDTTFLASDDVIFNDSASGTRTVNIDAANVTPNATVFDNSSAANYTLQSTGGFGISSGSFTKNNNGSVTVSTANTYTGPTIINGGAIILSGSGTLGNGSALSLNGGSLDLGSLSRSAGAVSITSAASSGDTLSNGSLTGTSYAVSNSSGNAVISANLLANGSAGLTKTGAGSLTLSGVNTYTGATTLNVGSVSLSGAGTLGSAAALTLNGGSLNLGGLSSTVGAVSVTTAASSGDTISNGSLTGTSYNASNTSGDAILSANLLANGATGFTKTGAGTTTLSGINTYTGATAVSAGTLKAGNNSAFSNIGALSLSNTGTFDLGGYNAAFTNLTGSATNTITTTGAGSGTDVLTISALGSDAGASALFTDNGSRLLQVSLTSGGAGSWQATSNINNTFSGGLILNGSMRASVLAGTLGTPGAITSGQFGKGAVTVNGNSQIWFAGSNRTLVNDVIVNGNAGNGNRNGTFRIGSNSAAVTGLEISGSINANLADAHFGADPTAAGSTLLLSGKLTGNSGFRFFQSANSVAWTTTLNNATGSPNDYNGNTTISSAQTTLALGAANQIPNGSGKGNVILTSGVLDLAGFNETINGLSGAGTVNNVTTGVANTLTLGDGDATGQNFSGAIQNSVGSLGLTKIGTGTQILSGTNTYTGATLISAGTLQIGNGAGTGVLSSTSTITNNGTLAFNRTGTVTQGTDFAAGITGNGALNTSGSGTLILSGTNSFTGSTTITNGELRLTSAGALDGTSSITVNSGRLSLDGGITAGTGKAVTVNGTGANFFGAIQGNAGTNTWAGNVVIGNTAGTRIGVNAGQLTISGVISGSNSTNGVTFRPNTGTALVLSGANTYAGDTTIVSGTGVVRLDGGDNRLPTGTRLVLGASGTSGILDLNGRNQSVAGLSVASGTTNEIRSATAATLTVTTDTGAPSSYSGLISGVVALTKTGADSLTLSGTNTYSGNTTISGGTLQVSGSIANSTVTVNAGTLASAATGTIGKGVTVNANAILAPGGSSVGAATVGADGLSFASGSIFEWDLTQSSTTSGFDTVAVGGNVSVDTANTIFRVVLGGTALTDIQNSSNTFWNTPNSTKTWSMESIFGKGLTLGSSFASVTTNTNVASFGSFSVSGTTLTWSAVPEPTSALAGLLLAAGLLRRRRA